MLLGRRAGVDTLGPMPFDQYGLTDFIVKRSIDASSG